MGLGPLDVVQKALTRAVFWSESAEIGVQYQKLYTDRWWVLDRFVGPWKQILALDSGPMVLGFLFEMIAVTIGRTM